MHLPHEVVHLGERRGRLVHDDVDAVVERLELAVGDQRGDLHDDVPAEVETGHLEVEPDQPVVAGGGRVVRGHRVRLMNNLRPMRGRRDSSLVGPRVMLRPLEARDHDAWREIRIRSRDWLEQWEPLPEPGTRDPTIDRDAFRARCGAWERQRQFDTAYGFGTFLLDGTLVGEVSLGSVLRGFGRFADVAIGLRRSSGGDSPATMSLAASSMCSPSRRTARSILRLSAASRIFW